MQYEDIVFGRYQVVDLLPGGGEANLAKACDLETFEAVVVKQLAAAPASPGYREQRARFERAGHLRVCHPVVVDPIHFGEEDGKVYIIMPFVEGEDLDQHVQARGGRLPVGQCLCILGELSDGLAAMHAKGIVHRDIKAQNVRVRPDGRVRILDLGICKLTDERTLTRGAGLLGSLRWMPPEQIADARAVDQRADVYAAGVLLYWMLTGQYPVPGNTEQEIAENTCLHVPTPPERLVPSVPSVVGQACMKALAKRPEARFARMADFSEALNDAVSSAGGHGHCTFCGAGVCADARFCQRCGAQVNAMRQARILCLACGLAAGSTVRCPGCNRPFSDRDHRLRFRTGSAAGKVFRIPEGTYLVGRDQICPRDYEISREHCHVHCVNGTVRVRDAGSTNRTYVDNLCVAQSTLLRPGQRLCVAGNTATFESHKKERKRT